MKLRVLDLFSGIGGFSLGLERTGGFETAAFCEYAEFPRKVLAKHWPDVRIYPDVRELTAERLNADGLGRIDLICGGYPCQPFSYAGKREGAEDDRHLWPEMRRLVKTLRPAWVIGENVAGHITMGLDDVLADLEGLSYATQAFVIPAAALGASHRRDRVWVVAYGKNMQCNERTDYAAELMGRGADWAQQLGNGDWSEDVADTRRKLRQRPICKPSSEETTVRCEAAIYIEQRGQDVAHAKGDRRGARQSFSGGCEERIGPREASQPWNDGETVADSDSLDAQGQFSSITDQEGRPRQVFRSSGSRSDGSGWWSSEPAVGRMAHGVPSRVDRLKALGNAVVPQIPELIGRAILKSMEAA